MSNLSQIVKEIEFFIEGASSVCCDNKIIAEKAKEKFGGNYSKFVEYLLLLRTEKFTAKSMAFCLNNRDNEDGFFEFERKCAERNNLVIVCGYSDDLIDLYGAISEEGDCFNGGDFHLEQENDHWILKEELGKCNNISAKWCEKSKITDDWEIIPWSYETDIPHTTFYMTHEGEPFCEGLVFDMKDLKKHCVIEVGDDKKY